MLMRSDPGPRLMKSELISSEPVEDEYSECGGQYPAGAGQGFPGVLGGAIARDIVAALAEVERDGPLSRAGREARGEEVLIPDSPLGAGYERDGLRGRGGADGEHTDGGTEGQPRHEASVRPAYGNARRGNGILRCGRAHENAPQKQFRPGHLAEPVICHRQ